MTRTTRHLMVGMIMTTLAGGGRAAVAAGVDTPAMGRVRSHHPGIASLIERAAERSKTFRGLVAAINTSNGIVYVEEGQCGRHVVKSCVAAVTQTATNRILVVKVDIRNADGELMGLIGHELRHAIEILGEPNVVDAVSMYFLYQRIGRLGTYTAFETQAAVQAGHAVRAEVSKYRFPAGGH
jgi:hypothetical protein